MPNHISNVITISGEKSKLLDVINLVKSKDNDISFSFESFFPKPSTEADWYNWNINNWGTKWDAYEVSNWICNFKRTPAEINISFQTAWSTPIDALIKLSKLSPDVKIFCEFADEDMGYNVGEYTIKNGVVQEKLPVFGTEESIRLAQEIHIKAEELYTLTQV